MYGSLGIAADDSGSYTWAGKPSAVGRKGLVIRIYDVGSTEAGTLWISDGTRWNPLGRQRIYNSVSDITILEATSTAEQKFVGLLLPGGLIGPGYEIEVTPFWTYNNNLQNKVLRVKLGTADDLSGTAFLTSTTSSTATAQNQAKIRTTSASANTQIGHAGSVSTPFGASTGAPITSSYNMADATYLVISGQCTSGAVSQTLKGYAVDISR